MPSVAEFAAAIERARVEREKREATRAGKRNFYASAAWRQLRYRVLADNARRNGGVARCELCGATAAPGAPLNVDHITPLSRDWSRRLDATNLQVLCGPCNHGKLNRDSTDFRPKKPTGDGHPR